MSDSMKKIFVVDDDKSIRWVLEKALTKNNYKVFVYDDPKAMILDIENFKPDVIISDIRMPGMSGIDMLEKIKREYPKIPIIIMTAFSDLETTVSSLKKGAYDYITKPFDINETVKLVEKACNNSTHSEIKDKIVSQVELNIPTFTKDNLPKELLSIEPVKPGSRNL